MGRLKFGNSEASPQRLATDIDMGSGTTLESSITTREAALQSAQIEALYQAGRAMTAMSTVLEEHLL